MGLKRKPRGLLRGLLNGRRRNPGGMSDLVMTVGIVGAGVVAYKKGWLADIGLTPTPGGTTPSPGGSGGGGGGGGTTLTQGDALDTIWARRPDLGSFYQANGWPMGTQEQKRAIVQNWLSMTDDTEVIAAGRDAVRYATAKGWGKIP